MLITGGLLNEIFIDFTVLLFNLKGKRVIIEFRR